MKRCYRGVPYDNATSPLEVTEGEIGGLYRGGAWRFHYPRHIRVPFPVHDVKYRGVAYRTGHSAIPTVVAHSATAVPHRTWPTLHKQERQKELDEATKTHLANIRKNLERRLAVAKAKGDEELVRLLKQEEMAFPLQ